MASNKQAEKLRAIALVMMLSIPFLMYAAANCGDGLWVLVSLFLMALNMLLAIKTG